MRIENDLRRLTVSIAICYDTYEESTDPMDRAFCYHQPECLQKPPTYKLSVSVIADAIRHSEKAV